MKEKMIVITGDRGIGKTTLLRNVIEQSKKSFCGILSERFEKGKGYYVEDVRTREKRILCSESGTGLKFGKFYFDPDALRFIEESLKRKGDILSYDEIGYLEVEEKIGIWEFLREPAIVIVRKELVDTIASRFNVEIFEVMKENRAQLKNTILKRIDSW
jgi:nucleoside-triphosphatase THEP1